MRHVILNLFFVTSILLEDESYAESHYCYVTGYRSTKTCTSGWLWSPICNYKSVSTTQRICCDAYYGNDCDKPKCGDWNLDITCNLVDEGVVIYKNGIVVTDSGGTCVAPNTCENCNEGFYPNSEVGKCKACPKIEKCNVHRCTNTGDVTCQFCHHEFNSEKLGWNKYTGLPDRKQCTQTCSWVQGFRCYPGSCSDIYYRYYNTSGRTNCKCSQGFTGTDCKTATGDYPMDLVEMEFEFHECSNELCPHIIVSGSKSWSNAKERVSIAIKTLAVDSFELPDPPEYIFTDTEIGLDSIAVSVTAKRGSNSVKWTDNQECSYAKACRYNKNIRIYTTGLSFIENGFTHGDRVLLNVRIKNGGYVSYQKIDERNFSPTKGRYTINGVEKRYDKELEIDMIAPYHCKENNPTCSSQPLRTSTDFVTGNQIALYWNGWSDDNSGITEYTIHLYLIKKAGSNTLKQDHGTTGESITTYSSARSATLNLEHPGPYAVELTAIDQAGNTKTARRLFFYDNMSEVSLNTSSSTMVSNANGNGWITQNTDSIDVAWAYRFQNIRHDNNCWLCRFEPSPTSVPFVLDDTSGVSERTWENIYNIKGIVRIELAYSETYEAITTEEPFNRITQTEFNQQRAGVNGIAIKDGKRVTFSVRGYDVVDAYAEDNVTVWIDTSPPIIENLWLTRGDIVNISVHNVTRLADMTIEWDVFDVHSGLYEISWRLFDNFSNTDVVYGHSYEYPQHESNTLFECEQDYANYARGPNCYCSPYHGCFHQHFQVIPPVIDLKKAEGSTQQIGGIDANSSEGVDERETYLEVTAVNNAGLTTIQTHKIFLRTAETADLKYEDGMAYTNKIALYVTVPVTLCVIAVAAIFAAICLRRKHRQKTENTGIQTITSSPTEQSHPKREPTVNTDLYKPQLAGSVSYVSNQEYAFLHQQQEPAYPPDDTEYSEANPKFKDYEDLNRGQDEQEPNYSVLTLDDREYDEVNFDAMNAGSATALF